MNPGTYCIHRSWGFGLISGFDEDRGMILIDFEDDERTSHAMDPVFCMDKLELLPDESILTQHRKNTERSRSLLKKNQLN
jgi:transcription elongation factor GreA-like protein